MADENLHAKHRARMQERVERDGLDSLAEHEALEYLLFLSIPRADTNALAHRLIQHFGDFCKVLEAEPEELMQVEGVGPKSARLISTVMACSRYYELKKRKTRLSLNSAETAIAYVKPLFRGVQNEQLYLILLDDACRPYYTAVPIGWQYVFPAKNNICVVFFRMSRRFRSKRKFILCFLRNYFEFAGSAPYAHKCGVLCFELYFERMPFLPFLFYSPYAGFCKNCIRRHVKPESSSVQVCPKCFRCPRSIRIINPRKSVFKHLGAQNFDNSMKTR